MIVNVQANNKVGAGEVAKNTLLPDNEFCTLNSEVTPSSVVFRVTAAVPTSAPNLKVASPTGNTNRILIYGMYSLYRCSR